MKKKKNFTDTLMEHSMGFAVAFLVILSLAAVIIVFGVFMLIGYWWDRIH